MESTEQRPAAKLTDRFLAFLVDFVPFYAGFVGSLYVLVVKLAKLPPTPQTLARQALLWTVLWLLYHALGNASGATLGKRLFGLRVEGLDGGRLGLGRAFVRAAAYLLSLPLNLGFLWSLVHPDSRTWHDLVAGSRVVEARPKSQGEALLAAVLSVAALAALVLFPAWAAFSRPTPHDLDAVRKAEEGLRILAAVQEAYKAEHGRYTPKLADLAAASGDVTAFKTAMGELFDPDGFVIETGGGGYVIRGRARDRRRTAVEVSGP